MGENVVVLTLTLICFFLLSAFFGVTLSGVLPLGVVNKYFISPTSSESILYQSGFDAGWKVFMLFIGISALNGFAFFVNLKYTRWRWYNVLEESSDAHDPLQLALLSLGCVVIELFLATIGIANILVSFSSFLMLFSVALVGGLDRASRSDRVARRVAVTYRRRRVGRGGAPNRRRAGSWCSRSGPRKVHLRSIRNLGLLNPKL
jgi:hypothetical protein